MDSNFVSFLPLILMQSIYAIFAFQIAKRTNRSVPMFVVLTIIPIVGAFFFIYVMWSTVIYTLDSINELKAKANTSWPQ